MVAGDPSDTEEAPLPQDGEDEGAAAHVGGRPSAPATPESEDDQSGRRGPVEPDTDVPLRRALADLDNLRKRSERELARVRSAERADMAALWLPIVDDLDRAIQHAGTDDGAMVEGVQAVRDQALSLLARLGFHRFDDIGKPFDPTRHEAVGVLDGEGEPGTVLAVVRPGYDAPGSVLRPAGVIVSRGT
ncbi:MAG TPA: nucleotide exchange factor GrpE [Acidimicrobiales bacterium]|nr:nucleotide exchange factor GrpE [Acidimicrobiales bacterium]